jgi:hypothetical protein
MANPEKVRLMQQRWQKTNPGSLLAASHRWRLKERYGMTENQYAELFFAQGGKCKICLQTRAKKLTVDHCHFTGKIRGLLCNECNRAIGWMKDSATRLERAAEYLRGEL